MSNMSYCRFQNTLNDLMDCYDNWDSELDDDRSLSNEEVQARKRLLEICEQIVDDYGESQD